MSKNVVLPILTLQEYLDLQEALSDGIEYICDDHPSDVRLEQAGRYKALRIKLFKYVNPEDDND
jgi:hypothetical protein